MDDETVRVALLCAKDEVRYFLNVEKAAEAAAKEPVSLSFDLLRSASFSPISSTDGTYQITEVYSDFLVGAAKFDREAYDHVIRFAVVQLLGGGHIPQSMRSFIAKSLDGSTKPPRKRQSKFLRNSFSVRLIETLVEEFGLTATRNEATEGGSACDVVAEAFSNYGKRLSYNTILKDMWKNCEIRRQVRHLNTVAASSAERRRLIDEQYRRKRAKNLSADHKMAMQDAGTKPVEGTFKNFPPMTK